MELFILSQSEKYIFDISFTKHIKQIGDFRNKNIQKHHHQWDDLGDDVHL